MTAFLIILGILVILYYAFVSIFGNWRMTANRVITIYIAENMQKPEEDKDWFFFHVLEAKYPAVTAGPLRKLYEQKEFVLSKIFEVSYERDELLELIKRLTLPSAILCCLVIERHQIVRKYLKSPEKLYEMIEIEVNRQGFKEFC